MKIKNLFIVFVLVLTSPILNAQEENNNIDQGIESIHITIEGMACQEGCANKIAENLLKAEGVKSAKVIYEIGKAVITFNPDAITISQLKNIITDTKVKEYIYTIKNESLNNKKAVE